METIIVVGFGGYGVQFMKQLEPHKSRQIDLFTIDENEQTEKGKTPHIMAENSEEYFFNSKKVTTLLDKCQQAKHVYLVVGAGGSYGSFMSLCFAEALAKQGSFFTLLITKPFSFEGTQRAIIAEGMITYIKEANYPYISFENNEVNQFFEEAEKQSLHDLFEKTNEPFLRLILSHEKEKQTNS